MIIVTRPSPYGEELTQLCHQSGLAANHVPFFSIIKGRDFEQLQQQLNQLEKDDIVIIVSPQVITLLETEQVDIDFPAFIKYFAVGKKTARQFEQISQRTVSFPVNEQNSEGLIDFLRITKTTISKRKILILRGDIGRTLLEDTLKQQGADVNNLYCYQRSTIDYPIPLFNDKTQYIFVITSLEHLLQLEKYCNQYHKQQCRLVVSSHRIMLEANLLAWQHIFLSENANNENLFKTIDTLCHNATIN